MYYRVQPYPSADLLAGEQETTYWDDDADDVVTVPGKATCESIETLARTANEWEDDWVLVTLDGIEVGRDGDTVFVRPSRIIATESVSKRFAAAVERVRMSHGTTEPW